VAHGQLQTMRGTPTPVRAHIVRQSLANILRQWQSVVVAAFAPDKKFASAPVDVIQLYSNDFLCGGPAELAAGHGVISATGGRISLYSCQQRFDLFRWQVFSASWEA